MSDERHIDDTIYCFLDTNIFLHFPMFDGVDWPSVVDAPAVCLMIAPIIVTELSDHKDDSHNERRQKRARDVLPILAKVLPENVADVGHVRKGVTIRDIPREPQIDWGALGLDPQIHDDRLIATILEFRGQNPDYEIRLITADLPLRLKARHHGIRVRDPADKLKQVPSSATPAEIENRKLKQQLQELQRRIPVLDFGFLEEGRKVVTVERPIGVIRTGGFTLAEIDEEVALHRTEHEAAARKARGKIDDREVEQFVAESERFLRSLPVGRKMERSHKFGPKCQLTFILTNGGSAPATDVALELAFPEGAFVVGTHDVHDFMWGEVIVPSEPVPEWTPSRDSLALFPGNVSHVLPPTVHANAPLPARQGPLYDLKGDRRVIWFTDAKLPQDSKWVMPTVTAYLPPEVAGGFAIEYTLRADELLTAIKGTLHVVWTPE